VLSLGLLGLRPSHHVVRPASRMDKLPRVTVWAWERREDLRAVDPAETAVAWLDRTVLLDGQGMAVLPRRQPLLLPAADSLVRIAVVRLETGTGAVLNEDSADAVAKGILEALPGESVAALQVDFDARRSEREWYGNVLRKVRAGMPAWMPLSMTALASWCSYDAGWIDNLPVDEAVPMLFRMEPDRRRIAEAGGLAAVDHVRDFAIREPLCAGSVGISTTEAWPRTAGLRVYVFPDRGWSRDGLSETVRSLQ
jgi:hypothetical protein